MDRFRMEISALYTESLSALPAFLNDRQQLINAATARRPWESECFFGEHNLTSFVKRIFGDYASCFYALLIARSPSILVRVMWTDCLLFILLLSFLWLVAATVGIFIYHSQFEANFDSTWRPATYDWYNFTQYGPQMEYEERNSLVDESFDGTNVLTRADHAFYWYASLILWYKTNYCLLMRTIVRYGIFVELISFCVSFCILFFLFFQLYNVLINPLFRVRDLSSEYSD